MKPRNSTVVTHIVTVSRTPTVKDGRLERGSFVTRRGRVAASLLSYGYDGYRVTVGARRDIPRAAKQIPGLIRGSGSCLSVPYVLESFTAYELKLTLGELVAIPVWHKPLGRALGFWLETDHDLEKLARWIEGNAKTIDAAIKRQAQIIDECFVSKRERSLREFYEE